LDAISALAAIGLLAEVKELRRGKQKSAIIYLLKQLFDGLSTDLGCSP